MTRRASVTAVAFCLMAALLVAAVWVRGLYARDEIVLRAAGRKWIVATFPHHVFVLGHHQPGRWRGESYELGKTQYRAKPQYLELRYDHGPGGLIRLGLPFWLPLLFALTPPVWWLLRRMQDVRRRRIGHCRACGYDLRASRERCPECGERIPDAAGAPTTGSLT